MSDKKLTIFEAAIGARPLVDQAMQLFEAALASTEDEGLRSALRVAMRIAFLLKVIGDEALIQSLLAHLETETDENLN